MSDLALQIKQTVNAQVEKLESSIDAKLLEMKKQIEESGEANAATKADLANYAAQYNEMVQDVNKWNDELDSALQKLSNQSAQNQPVKSIVEKCVNSDELKAFPPRGSSKSCFTFQNNTIVGVDGSGNPEDTLVPKDYIPGIVSGAFRPLTILDVIMRGRTDSNDVQFTRELLWTNNAAETTEGAQKPESDLTFEPVQLPIATIAHFIKASRQVLDDAPLLMSYVDRRLTHGVRTRIQNQIIAGDGVIPNIGGIELPANHTAFADPGGLSQALDILNAAKYQVVASEYTPTAFILNPTDWGAIERLQTTTDAYLAGDGAALTYINNGMTPLIWGLPVIISTSMTSGNFFCLSMEALMYIEREGVTIEAFEQDADNVQKNLVTIRAEGRGQLAVFRPASIVYGSLTPS